jgi:hypothetical protein
MCLDVNGCVRMCMYVFEHACVWISSRMCVEVYEFVCV